MKFAAIVSLASVVTLAAASPWATPTMTATTTQTLTITSLPPESTGAGSCTTGPIQCCESVATSTSADGSAILGLAGIVLEGINVLLGLNCSPISVIGVGTGNACSANAVCCDNNNTGGLVSIGCVPVQL